MSFGRRRKSRVVGVEDEVVQGQVSASTCLSQNEFVVDDTCE